MNTTAPEILDAFRGKNLDYFVTGWGTGGTYTGTSRVLKIARPNCQIILAEPEAAPLVTTGNWSPHPIQGWTPDFVPTVLDKTLYHEALLIPGAEAVAAAKKLASSEGIFCGISSGATFVAAMKIAEKAPKGSNIVCMLPDTGERYFSTILFKDISEDSDVV